MARFNVFTIFFTILISFVSNNQKNIVIFSWYRPSVFLALYLHLRWPCCGEHTQMKKILQTRPTKQLLQKTFLLFLSALNIEDGIKSFWHFWRERKCTFLKRKEKMGKQRKAGGPFDPITCSYFLASPLDQPVDAKMKTKDWSTRHIQMQAAKSIMAICWPQGRRRLRY